MRLKISTFILGLGLLMNSVTADAVTITQSYNSGPATDLGNIVYISAWVSGFLAWGMYQLALKLGWIQDEATN